MHIIKGSWLFYKRLILPSLSLSILLTLFSMEFVDFFQGIAISYMILTPFFHFFLYEHTVPNEYFFYHNLGLNKISLWINTMSVSLIIGFILMFV